MLRAFDGGSPELSVREPGLQANATYFGVRDRLQNDEPKRRRRDHKLVRVEHSGTLGKRKKMKMSPGGAAPIFDESRDNERKVSGIGL